MPRVVFTANLQRHVSAPPSEVAGRTVRAALEAVFAENPRLRSYVLDDQDRLRHHVVVFVGNPSITWIGHNRFIHSASASGISRTTRKHNEDGYEDAGKTADQVPAKFSAKDLT